MIKKNYALALACAKAQMLTRHTRGIKRLAPPIKVGDFTDWRPRAPHLAERAIKVRISTIYKDVLTCHVSSSRREQEDRHRCNLLGQRHAFTKRDLSHNSLQFLFRIWERVQPLAIERSHDFGWDDGVYANFIRQQLSGPFAREGQNRSF